MARKLVATKEKLNTVSLDVKLSELIPQYAETKELADDYKKQADKQNKEIKETFKAIKDESQTLEIDGYIANYQKQERTSMNEEKVLEAFGNCKKVKLAKDLGIIKTKEYIDYDALEKAIYDGRLSEKLLAELQDCEEVKIVEVLKVTKKKEK